MEVLVSYEICRTSRVVGKRETDPILMRDACCLGNRVHPRVGLALSSLNPLLSPCRVRRLREFDLPHQIYIYAHRGERDLQHKSTVVVLAEAAAVASRTCGAP